MTGVWAARTPTMIDGGFDSQLLQESAAPIILYRGPHFLVVIKMLQGARSGWFWMQDRRIAGGINEDYAQATFG